LCRGPKGYQKTVVGSKGIWRWPQTASIEDDCRGGRGTKDVGRTRGVVMAGDACEPQPNYE